MVGFFQTPSNEKSFSGLIDSAILQTGKPGSLIAAVQFANLTIRECQAFGLFARDLIEEQLSVDVVPYVWLRPINFRKLRTVKYVTCCAFPKFYLPGKIQQGVCEYFYAADDYFVFKGASLNETINLATYYWQKRLVYYGRLGTLTTQYPGGPYLNRPAYYDDTLEMWQYLSADQTTYDTTTGDPTQDSLRQRNVSNWLVADWYDLILSGTKAKLFSKDDDNRANREYATYKAAQKLLQTTEAYEAEGF